MSHFRNQEYLIERSSEELWNFYYNQQGLYCKIRSADGKWLDSVMLMDNVSEEFSASIDPSDNIHIVCADKKGQLLYFLHDGINWYSKRLATFPAEKYRLKYLTISVWNKYINVFYAINPVNNPLIWSIHHNFWNGTTWKSLRVGHITGSRYFGPLYIGYDHTGTVHMIYRAVSLGTFKLHYCKFHPEYLIWSNPEKITNTALNDGNFYMLTDRRDTLHLVWSYPAKNSIEIKYMQKSQISYPRGFWKNNRLIHSCDSNGISPLIYSIGRTLWIVWTEGRRMLGSFSNDAGNSWSKAEQLAKLPYDAQPQVFSLEFSGNSNLPSGHVWGYREGNSIILPLIGEILGKPSIKPASTKNEKGVELEPEEKNGQENGKSEDIAEKSPCPADCDIEKLSESLEKIDNCRKELENQIYLQSDHPATKICNSLDEMKSIVLSIAKSLLALKEENLTLTSAIKDWEARYQEHQSALAELEKKYDQLLQSLDRLTEKNFMQKIIDYFKHLH